MLVDEVLKERGARYGEFSEHAKIAQGIQDAMRNNLGWLELPDVHKQALTVIADKIARAISGDHNYLDNWIDISGYATLVQRHIEKEEK